MLCRAVLIGQDHRSLGALVVPDSEALEALAQERGEALSLPALTGGSRALRLTLGLGAGWRKATAWP